MWEAMVMSPSFVVNASSQERFWLRRLALYSQPCAGGRTLVNTCAQSWYPLQLQQGLEYFLMVKQEIPHLRGIRVGPVASQWARQSVSCLHPKGPAIPPLSTSHGMGSLSIQAWLGGEQREGVDIAFMPRELPAGPPTPRGFHSGLRQQQGNGRWAERGQGPQEL